MPGRVPLDTIKAMLSEPARVERLVHLLVPGATRHGGYWQGPNPTRLRDSGTSFTVYTNGGFQEFDEMDRPGTVLDLIIYCRQCTFSEALRWAEEFLGLRGMSDAERRRLDDQARQKAAYAKADEEERRRQRVAAAQNLYRVAPALKAVGPVADYLAGRAVPVGAVPNPENGERQRLDLRLWGPSAKAAPHVGPALVLPIQQLDDTISGIQAIFVQPDGSGKLPVSVPKPILGEKKGGVVRISRGPTNRTVREWLASGEREDLMVFEGYETGRGPAIVIPECRVWSCLDLGNIGDLPPELARHVNRLFVGFENDTKPEVLRKREKVLEKLEAAGFDWRPFVPPWGNDFNDTLRGE